MSEEKILTQKIAEQFLEDSAAGGLSKHKGDLNLNGLTELEVDAVIIAGAVFDSGLPPQKALRQWFEFVQKLKQIGGCRLVVIGVESRFSHTTRVSDAHSRTLGSTGGWSGQGGSCRAKSGSFSLGHTDIPWLALVT
jgi:hypothetical protein